MTKNEEAGSVILRLRRSGRSAVELTREALTRMEKTGGRNGLNCIAEVDPTALQQAETLDRAGNAEQPLFGIPVLVKDNIDVKGLHTTAGSLVLADNLAENDAPVVRNLRKNGAVILGKTNMTEFANYTADGMPGGYSSRGGQVIHAIDPKLNPSGSSSGSGVAVSAGIVPAAVGTDTSFSITACAQTNGICGIKPPAGTLSADGIIPIAHTLDSAGSMAACFTDALLLYSAMRETPFTIPKPAEPGTLRIAVNTANQDKVSEEQQLFLNGMLHRLKDLGASVSELLQPYTPYQGVIMQWEFRPHLEAYLVGSNASVKTLREIVGFYEADPERMLRYGDARLRASLDETPGGLEGAPYRQAMAARSDMIAAVRAEIEAFDAVIMTGPTNIMHFCGLPSVTVASDTKSKNGVRRALILYGADETRLYRAALAVEQLGSGC